MKNAIVIGGAKAWRVRAYKNLGIAFHWWGDEFEPTMFLFPQHSHLMLKKVIPFGIPLSSCHEVVLSDTKGEGVDTRALLSKARRAVEVMGMDLNSYNEVRDVADCILRFIPDLLQMPPAPDWYMRGEKPPAAGEASLIIGGETVAETDL